MVSVSYPGVFRRAGGGTVWLVILALGALWLPWFVRLARVWATAPGQSFGFVVPMLAVWLAWERARTVVQPSFPDRVGRAAAWFFLGAGVLAFAIALPVLEANALWPTAQWLATLGAAAASLALLALAGGRPWVWQGLFPIAFLFTALTWPTWVQSQLVPWLSAFNAGVAAELVSAAGYPATVSGSVIEVGTGFVGIDEACSGLRSLQAVWMAGWLLGECFHLNWPRRLLLVVISLVVALTGNLLRTAFLTWAAAAYGLDASMRWHDTAGTVELVGTLLVVVGVAMRLASEARAPVSTAYSGPGHLPRSAVWLVLAAGVLTESGTQGWYAWHEKSEADRRVDWELSPPAVPGWAAVEVPAQAREILQYTEAAGYAWRDPELGAPALAFLIGWKGDGIHGETAEWHDPTICLPAAGVKLTGRLGEVTVPVEGVALTLAGFRFETAQQAQYVFFAHWDATLGRSRSYVESFADLRRRRLQRVLDGRRKGDIAHLTLVISVNDDAAALAWLQEWAPKLLHPRR